MIGPASLDRRALLAGLLPTSLAICAQPAQAAQGPLDAATRTWLRLVAPLDGGTLYSVMDGMVWGFKPQADDLTVETFARRLYGYRSLLARRLDRRPDGALALTTKGWTFYRDAESRQPVSRLMNPYTGQPVDCPPLSGPVSTAIYGPASPSRAPMDLSRRRIGEHAFVDVTRISRFKPADISWFKLEADLTSYCCRAADLDRDDLSFLPSTWSHNLVAEWQTWMKMHGAPGHILFKGDGAALASLDAAPEGLLEAVERHFPNTIDAVKAWTREPRS